MNSLLVLVCYVLTLAYCGSSSCHYLAFAFRLADETSSGNVTVDYTTSMIPPWSSTAGSLLPESEKRKSRGAAAGSGDFQQQQQDRLLVQTLNGILRGTRKNALGDAVDVFLGVN